MNVVLIEPEIPQNAGNIVRTCACTNTSLYLIKPLGFETDDKHLKRAGLDYWDFANITILDSFDELYKKHSDKQFYFASTKANNTYVDVKYSDDCFIVFGKESFGIRESILKEHYKDCIRIPMKEGTRSLNLANSVAIILYEANRQQNFASLQKNGHLTGRVD